MYKILNNETEATEEKSLSWNKSKQIKVRREKSRNSFFMETNIENGIDRTTKREVKGRKSKSSCNRKQCVIHRRTFLLTQY
jgi:hypothetical protein